MENLPASLGFEPLKAPQAQDWSASELVVFLVSPSPPCDKKWVIPTKKMDYSLQNGNSSGGRAKPQCWCSLRKRLDGQKAWKKEGNGIFGRAQAVKQGLWRSSVHPGSLLLLPRAAKPHPESLRFPGRWNWNPAAPVGLGLCAQAQAPAQVAPQVAADFPCPEHGAAPGILCQGRRNGLFGMELGAVQLSRTRTDGKSSRPGCSLKSPAMPGCCCSLLVAAAGGQTPGSAAAASPGSVQGVKVGGEVGTGFSLPAEERGEPFPAGAEPAFPPPASKPASVFGNFSSQLAQSGSWGRNVPPSPPPPAGEGIPVFPNFAATPSSLCCSPVPEAPGDALARPSTRSLGTGGMFSGGGGAVPRCLGHREIRLAGARALSPFL